MSEAPRTTHVMPWLTNDRWMWHWPRGRIAVAVSFLLGAIAAFLTAQWIVSGASVVSGAILITPAFNGRDYIYQLPARYYKSYRVKRHEKRRGPLRSKELSEVLFSDDAGREVKKAVAPVSPQIVPLNEGRAGYLTEIHTPRCGRHTLYTIGDGFDAYMASDPEEAVMLSDAFSRVLSQASAEFGVSGVFGSLYMARVPEDATDAWSYYYDNMHQPEGEELTPVQADYLQHLADSVDRSADYIGGVGISVPRPRAWNRAKSPDLIDPDAIRDAIGYRMSEMLRDGLGRIRVNNVRRPTPYEVARLLRAGLDVMSMEQFYEDWFRDRQRLDEGSLTTFSDSLTMQTGLLPDDWSPHHSYLRIGDTYHRMFHLPRFASRFVVGGALQELYKSPADLWWSIADVYQTIDASREKRRLKFQRTQSDASEHKRRSKGASDRQEEIEARRELEDADKLFYYSKGPSVKKNLLPAVSSNSLAGLNDASNELLRLFRQFDLHLHRVQGRDLQVRVQLARLGILSERI